MENIIGVISCHLEFTSLREAFSKVQNLGLGTIEWFESQNTSFSEPEVAAQIVRLSNEFCISASYHAPYLGDWNLGRVSSTDAKQRVKEMLARANRLEAKLVTIHLGSYEPKTNRDRALENVVDVLTEAARIAGDLNIHICVENFTSCHNDTDMGDKTEDFVFLFENIQSSAVGLTLDVGHANVTGNLSQLIQRFGDRIYNTHLHDTDGITDGHLAPGHGTIDWENLFSKIVKAKYQGPLNFEFHENTGQFPSFIKRIRDLCH